jgi:hypothetical protein
VGWLRSACGELEGKESRSGGGAPSSNLPGQVDQFQENLYICISKSGINFPVAMINLNIRL